MNHVTIKKFHQIYNVVLSIVIVIAGICLITACLGIYQSGDQPYSREAVATAFAPISFPVYLCLGMIALGFLFEFLSPTETGKNKTPRAYLHMIAQLRLKKDFTVCPNNLQASIEKEEKNRKLHTFLSVIILGICSILFFIYAFNGAHFHQSEINTSMIQAMYRLIPCVAVSFGYGIFTLYYNRASMEREIELLKQVPATDAAKISDNQRIAKAKQAEQQKNNQARITIFRNAFLCFGILILIYGFISGGTADVLTKAINICTECIGLG